MAKVKCKYCGKEIDKKNAFIVPVSAKRNNYYCCEEHSKLLSDRDLFYKKAMDIFGQTTNTVFYTEFDGISKVHSWYKMKSYLEDNEDYLRYVLSKIDGSEYGRIRYFSAVLKNTLGDYKPQRKKVEIPQKIEGDLHEVSFTKKNNNKGLDDLLNDIVG